MAELTPQAAAPEEAVAGEWVHPELGTPAPSPSAATPTETPSPTPPPDPTSPLACVGDCNADGAVAVNELVLGVSVALLGCG